MKKAFLRAIAKLRVRTLDITTRVSPPQCACGFPADYLVTEASGRKRWLCAFGFEEMIDVESGRKSRWVAYRVS